MRIAVISRTFARTGGGAESYAVEVVRQLAPRHEVHVFAQQTDAPVPGVHYHPVFRLCEKPRWINQLLFAVATWWATRRGFDVVHSHENTWHGQVQTVHVRPTRYNLFHGRHGWRLALRWLKVLLSPRLLTYVWLEATRFMSRPGRAVVATSDMLRAECAVAYPASAVCLSVVTPGVHGLAELPRQDQREQARQQLGLPVGPRLLLFVANDYARKGLDALLQALQQLPADVQLAVVGSRKPVAHYREQATRLGVAGRVHFLGPLADVSLAYRAADVLAHPTQEDTYAMVVLEAMAHGLSVVVSGPAHCGISRELRDGQEALLLDDPRDATALGQKLAVVLTQPDLARHLRDQGRAFASRHRWESAALQYEALYQQAVPAIS